MAMKEQPRIVHKSMLGKEIDMNKLTLQNEMTVAVGNIKVNARGDELGPGGKIIRKREDVLKQAASGAPAHRNIRSSQSTPQIIDDEDESDNLIEKEDE